MRTLYPAFGLLLAAAVGACGPGTKSAATATPGGDREGTVDAPVTGDPLPTEPVSRKGCEDTAASVTRWLGWKPRVPLAVSDRRRLGRAGQPCCAPWSRIGTKWRAVDAWGQVLGVAAVKSGEGHDLTRCYELVLQPESLDKRAVLFASTRGSWKPPRTARWKPTPGEAAGLDRALETAESVYVDPEIRTTRKGVRAPGDRPRLYFQLPAAKGSQGEQGDQPTRFAVVGGPLLVIAYLGSDGTWYLAHVNNDLVTAGGPAEPYAPLAAFDMDGNGYPEVVYQWNVGHTWADVVLRVEPYVRTCWTVVAESVGGATL